MGIVEIKILTDEYPAETQWTLTETTECLEGNQVGSGGPYSRGATEYSKSYCLAEGKYEFLITDSYNDGMCCGYGEGKYEILKDQQLIHTGGNFGQSESKIFGSCDGPINCDNDDTWKHTTNKGKTRKCGWVFNRPDKRCKSRQRWCSGECGMPGGMQRSLCQHGFHIQLGSGFKQSAERGSVDIREVYSGPDLLPQIVANMIMPMVMACKVLVILEAKTKSVDKCICEVKKWAGGLYNQLTYL